MKNRRFALAGLLSLASLTLLFPGCATEEVVSPINSDATNVEDLYGTWRQTDGSLFILINETTISFFEPNSSINEFWNYEFDGQFLTLYPPGQVAVLKVELMEYRMTLTEVSGEGYAGVFQRIGNF